MSPRVSFALAAQWLSFDAGAGTNAVFQGGRVDGRVSVRLVSSSSRQLELRALAGLGIVRMPYSQIGPASDPVHTLDWAVAAHLAGVGLRTGDPFGIDLRTTAGVAWFVGAAQPIGLVGVEISPVFAWTDEDPGAVDTVVRLAEEYASLRAERPQLGGTSTPELRICGYDLFAGNGSSNTVVSVFARDGAYRCESADATAVLAPVRSGECALFLVRSDQRRDAFSLVASADVGPPESGRAQRIRMEANTESSSAFVTMCNPSGEARPVELSVDPGGTLERIHGAITRVDFPLGAAHEWCSENVIGPCLAYIVPGENGGDATIRPSVSVVASDRRVCFEEVSPGVDFTGLDGRSISGRCMLGANVARIAFGGRRTTGFVRLMAEEIRAAAVDAGAVRRGRAIMSSLTASSAAPSEEYGISVPPSHGEMIALPADAPEWLRAPIAAGTCASVVGSAADSSADLDLQGALGTAPPTQPALVVRDVCLDAWPVVTTCNLGSAQQDLALSVANSSPRSQRAVLFRQSTAVPGGATRRCNGQLTVDSCLVALDANDEQSLTVPPRTTRVCIDTTPYLRIDVVLGTNQRGLAGPGGACIPVSVSDTPTDLAINAGCIGGAVALWISRSESPSSSPPPASAAPSSAPPTRPNHRRP